MKSKRSRRVFKGIIISFSISFLLMLVLTIYAFRQVKSTNEYSAQVDHTNALISELYKIDIINRDLDVKERGFMLTGDSALITELNNNIKQITPALHALKTLVADNKEQAALLIRLRTALTLRIDAISKNLSYNDTVTTKQLSPFFKKGRDLKFETIKYVTLMLANEYTLLAERHRKKESSEELAHGLIQWLMILFFFVTFTLFLVLIRQVFIRRKYQEELQRRLIDLKRSNEEQEQIAHAMSHNIQEPLRKVLLFSNKLLHVKDLPVNIQEVVKRIDSSAIAMHTLVQDMEILLGLKNDDYQENINLNYLLKDVIDNMTEIKNHHPEFKISQLPSVQGNYKQIQLLFKCLLDNAIKFAKPDEPLYIKIQEESLPENNNNHKEKEYYQIIVKDNGEGFDNVYADKIFRIFERLHIDDTHYKGKGIGLTLCQRIMANHNGRIKAQGKPGEGAIFELYFPTN